MAMSTIKMEIRIQISKNLRTLTCLRNLAMSGRLASSSDMLRRKANVKTIHMESANPLNKIVNHTNRQLMETSTNPTIFPKFCQIRTKPSKVITKMCWNLISMILLDKTRIIHQSNKLRSLITFSFNTT